MINSYWEDLKLEDSQMGEIHETLLSEMEIPSWLKIKCPFCNTDQPLRSIREFGIKLNARNMGDLFVVACCYSCKQMDTIYFKSEIVKITDFIDFLKDIKKPHSPPVVEEKMYKERYNNMLEESIKRISRANSNKDANNANN